MRVKDVTLRQSREGDFRSTVWPATGKNRRESVKQAMDKMKKGNLKSGRSGKSVRNPKQAIAIGLSEARKKGARVPPKKTGRKSAGRKKS